MGPGCKETARVLQEEVDPCKKSVSDILEHFGMDPAKPVEMQKDFAFLREVRVSSENVKSKTLIAVVTAVVGGILSAIWFGIKHFLHD